MALFKVSKGLAKNLMTNVPNAKEGFAYFTTDDGKFYIDIAGDGTSTTKAVIGTNRIPLNAYTSDVLKASSMPTDDNIVYPILAFSLKDATKNLIEAKYTQIGIKNGSLVIPNIVGKDEILISNTGAGRGIVIDNTNGTGHAIEITSGKGIKVAQDPTENLELTTKQYVDNQNVVLELNMAGSTYWTNQASYDFTLSAKAQAAYSRLIEAIEKGYIPTVIIHDIDNTYIYKYSFTQNLILTALLVFTVEIPLSQDGNHMGRDFIAFQSNGSGSTLTVQRLNKPLEYIPGDGKVNQILSVSNNGQATWLDIPSIEDLGGATKDHTHDDRYYTENEINDKLKAINDKIGALLGANDALIFKGIIDDTHSLPTTGYEVGWTYRINKAGTYVGQKCEQGDLIICIADALSTSTPHWTVAQTNIDGAVIGPTSAIDNHIAVFNNTTGKVIKDSGFTLNDFATANHNHDSNYVKKTGDTMTGQLAVDKAGYGFRINNGSTGYISLSRDDNGAQLYGLWDCIKQQWIVQSDGSNISFHGSADMVKDYNDNNTNIKIGYRGAGLSVNNINYICGFTAGDNDSEIKIKDISKDNLKSWLNYTPGDIGAAPNSHSHNYLPLSGGTLTGNLTVSRSDTNDASVRVTNSNGSIGLLSSTNRGLYDYTKSKWVIYTDGTKASTSYALYGAVWNDYAEFREGDTIDAGRCVVEVGDDTLITSTERMMPGANITSDTFGFAIGETEQAKTPIAVSGRVLAYPYESREEFKKNIGRPVCSGPNGTVSIMTDEEYRNKGYCAIGTISAVPDYEEWGTGKVKVNGRVWIKVF